MRDAEPATTKRWSILDPFLPYLASRWGQGCHNALGLWRELRAQGFRGSKEIVRYHLSGWRAQPPEHLRYSRGGAPQPRPLSPPSPRRAAWMLLKAGEEGKAEHRAFAEGMCSLCPEVAAAAGLAREFSRIVRERCVETLAGWLDAAATSGVAEFEGFAAGQDGWEQVLEANKQTYFEEFVGRTEFEAQYLRAMTGAEFVDALNANAGGALSAAERDALVAGLEGGLLTRAEVLRAVAEDADFGGKESNRAFVLMQYFGYLRRNPDEAPDTDFGGWQFWLSKLEEFGGDFGRAAMVRAFIESIEYRQRFGQ